MKNRVVLLNPGPVTLSEKVRAALVRGDWCHREDEFADLTKSLNRRLAGVYRGDFATRHVSVLIAGSGTCAVEAMLATLAPADAKTLVLANGVYGERMATMLARMRKPHEVQSAGWSEPIDFAAAEARMAVGDISHVVAVQHETTTGRLNDIAKLGSVCRANGVKLLLDSVSAFGAEDIRFDEWNVEGLAATANKCLHGVPGISFVIADRERLAKPSAACPSVYLDLSSYFATQHGEGFSPFTLAVNSAFGLDAALDEFNGAGGWSGRRARYTAIADRIATRLETLGVEPMLPRSERSITMQSHWVPKGIEYRRLHDELKEAGFIIYAGQGPLAGQLFRIAHMGDITDGEIDRLLQSLTRALSR